ncbi:AAA domain-containing protein [Hymenobacter humi]|uniref:AAA domain-containing protein n=1 Tax=Hymenobacter humi TaxID=1411620 RepID=A0ABW2U9J3_9BACT
MAQEVETSAVAPEVADLLRTELGLSNLRNSYFERLFRRAESRWPHAHGTLADQYRMHEDLAALVNQDFYENHCGARCPGKRLRWTGPPGPKPMLPMSSPLPCVPGEWYLWPRGGSPRIYR